MGGVPNKKAIHHVKFKTNMTYGNRAEIRLQDIATASTTTKGVSRLPWTPEHRAALEHISRWMEIAGLEVTLDPAGTLVGSSPNSDGKPWLFLGSHQDSVPSGGRYDGIMGIALACLAAEALRDKVDAFPFALRVLAFADEEGFRFPTALIGPRALAGTLDPEALEMTDKDGMSMREAMNAFGLSDAGILDMVCDPAQAIGYLEAHIEQGPVLETAGHSVAAVSAICGISRFDVTVQGTTGHAGTVPMVGRNDALVAAGRAIARVSELAVARDVRATVGTLSIKPGAVNAIPSEVRLTLEVRSETDKSRAAFEAEVLAEMKRLAGEEGSTFHATRTYEQCATICDPALTKAMEKAIRDCGLGVKTIPSGATHDASAMADLCPVAMLFVRCRGGISHRPDEFASAADMDVAVRVLATAIEHLARGA